MNLLLNTIKRVLPQVNKKAHDFTDVERLARREKISLTVADYRPEILGYYTVRRIDRQLKRFIVINSGLKTEVEKTFVGLHELGHHFLHAPISWRVPFYCRGSCEITKSKFDCEADAFALLAMVPQRLLFEMRDMSPSHIEPESVPYLIRRQKLYEQHGI